MEMPPLKIREIFNLVNENALVNDFLRAFAFSADKPSHVTLLLQNCDALGMQREKLLNILFRHSISDCPPGFLDILLKAAGDIQACIKDPKNIDMLFHAIYAGNDDIIKIFLDQQCNRNRVLIDPGHIFNNKTPLQAALYSENLKISLFLLEHGALLYHGNEFLLFDAISTDSPELINLLVEFDVNINALDSRNISPLSYAICHHRTKAIETLLSLGANPNKAADSPELSPLHMAICFGDLKAVVLLINHGANINEIVDSQSLIQIAENQNRSDIAKHLLIEKFNQYLNKTVQRPMDEKKTRLKLTVFGKPVFNIGVGATAHEKEARARLYCQALLFNDPAVAQLARNSAFWETSELGELAKQAKKYF